MCTDQIATRMSLLSSAMPALLAAFNNVSVVGGSAAPFAPISRQRDEEKGSQASSGEE